MIAAIFPQMSIGSLVEKVSKAVEVQPTTVYHQIGIRSHGRGLFDKPPVTGTQLGNKRVFWIEPNCFVVNIVFAWEQAVGKTMPSDLGKIASHRFPMYRPKLGKVDIDFLTYLFKTKYGKELLGLASPGGAGRNKTLGQSEFLKIRIHVPPIAEQRRIAEILSTWDRAIAVQEQLVANARAQKKALMQTLLTGTKKRLPGFKGEWKTIAIKSMGSISSGGTPDSENEIYWNGHIPWTTPTDITALKIKYIKDTKRKISSKGLENCSAKLLPIGTLLICTRATIGDMAIAAVPVSTNQGFKNLTPNSSFVVEFLFHLFTFYKHIFVRYACGSTFLELSKFDFEKREFHVPAKNEQQAIANVLESADFEIESFEHELKTLRQIKSALMQQLLTGKRRVKVEVAEAGLENQNPHLAKERSNGN